MNSGTLATRWERIKQSLERVCVDGGESASCEPMSLQGAAARRHTIERIRCRLAMRRVGKAIDVVMSEETGEGS